MSRSPALEVARYGGLVEVRLNRPDAGNALSNELKETLAVTLVELATDENTRAVLLSGAGPAFCVGQDLGELASALRDEPERASDTVGLHYSPIARTLASMPKPVVAAVHGTCVGAGLGFALACDLQVWGSGATLGTAFSRVGLTCDSGLSATLPTLVGAARARELVLLAETFTPDQAAEWGFAGPVVPRGDVRTRALEMAGRLADGPTVAYASSKRLLALGAGGAFLDEVLAAEEREQARCGASIDHPNAVAAFLGKRSPVFVGG